MPLPPDRPSIGCQALRFIGSAYGRQAIAHHSLKKHGLDDHKATLLFHLGSHPSRR